MTVIFGGAVQGEPPPMERGSGPPMDYFGRCLPDFGLVCFLFNCLGWNFSDLLLFPRDAPFLKERIIICGFYACFLTCKLKLGLPFWTFRNPISEHVTSFIALLDADKGVFC